MIVFPEISFPENTGQIHVPHYFDGHQSPVRKELEIYRFCLGLLSRFWPLSKTSISKMKARILVVISG